MKIFFSGIFLIGLISACVHQTKKASDPQMENMARMHSEMADCLRSDKGLEACHQQMMAACHTQGEEACPMMKAHKEKGGMGMMQQMDKPKAVPAPSETDEHAAHHPETKK